LEKSGGSPFGGGRLEEVIIERASEMGQNDKK
jgi:hypothetical protein